MKIKKNISLFFLYLAMAVFLLHSFVPHCHCSDGQVSFLFHHHHECCEAVSCQHHHCSDCGNETHICHNHHASDDDGDCTLTNPFLKVAEEDSKVQVPISAISFHFGNSCSITGLEIEDESLINHNFLDVIEHYRSVLLTSSIGLRAPPRC